MMTKLPPEWLAPKYNAIIRDIMVKFHNENRAYWESKPIEERKCHYVNPYLISVYDTNGFKNYDYY
jgi:hypothetical protein